VAEAIDVVRGLGSLIQPLLFVSEIRTIRADDLWLSPEQGRDTVAFHFTWHRDEPAVLAVRPHWGKVFTTSAATIAGAYDRMPEFLALRDRFDPNRVFGNEYLTRVLTR
jgi:xylitol oxidase